MKSLTKSLSSKPNWRGRRNGKKGQSKSKGQDTMNNGVFDEVADMVHSEGTRSVPAGL